MKNCGSCNHDKKGMVCLQGHVRRTKYEGLNAIGHIDLENCHAWEEKPFKCWCERGGEKRLQVHDYTIDKWSLGRYQMRSVEIAQYCPYCGKGIQLS